MHLLNLCMRRWSRPRAICTNFAAPSAPVLLPSFQQRDRSATASWQPPESDGGGPIERYELRCQAADQSRNHDRQHTNGQGGEQICEPAPSFGTWKQSDTTTELCFHWEVPVPLTKRFLSYTLRSHVTSLSQTNLLTAAPTLIN